LKICIIAPIFEPWNKGGDGKYTSLLAHGFSKEHEVVVITTPGPSERKSNQMESNLRIIELKQSNVIPYYFYNKNDPPVGFGNRMIWHLFDIWNFSVYRQIKKILEKEKPDIVHTNAIKGMSSSVFSAVKSSKLPHVYTIHDYELISRWVTLQRKGKPLQFNLFDRIYSNYMRNISSSVSSVIFPAQHIKDLFLKKQYFKNSKIYMINHGIKIKENVQPKNGTAKNFMYLGRLHKSKGIDLVIRAFKKVKKKDIALHIVGEGAFLNELKKIASDDKRIIFHGFVDSIELEKMFNMCSYGIVPSLWQEVFGMITIEFMSSGLPVLGSNKGATPELVQDGINGFIFDPHSEDDLYQIIEKIISDDKILNLQSKNALESANKFTLENELEKTVKVYSSLLN